MKYLFYLAIAIVLQSPPNAFAQKKPLQAINSLIKRNPDTAFVRIKANLNAALQRNDLQAAAVSYQYLGELFYYQAAYTKAVDYYYKANEIFKKTDDKRNLAKNLNMIGQAYYYGKQYGIALSRFSQALQLYKQAGDHSGVGESYGLIGQSHEKNGKYQVSMKYQRLALEEYKKSGDKSGLAKIYENMGSIYEDKLPMDSALKYYELALKLNQQNHNDPAQTEIVNNIGDVFRKTGQYAKALGYTRNAMAMAVKMNDQYQLSAAYRDLSKNFDLMQQYDSAYHYSELGRNIFLTIFTEDNNKQLALLQTLFEIQQKDDAILRFENDRKANHYIILATVLIILLLISLVFVTMSRQRLKLRNEQAQKNTIQGELELKSKELTSNTLHVIQKNQFLDELKAQMLEIVKDDKRDQKKQLQQVLQKINQNINHESHWKEFSGMFEQIHHSFFEKLKAHCAELTANDLRLVALIKMNLSSKDMALLFGISQDSLRVSRYRLRKKLNISQGENLTAFIQSL